MKLTMIKRVVLILMLGITTGISATSNPFTVTPPAAVQGMVAGSSQQLLYSLSSLAPKSSPVIVQCTFTPTNPSQLSYSFNDAGCVTGVGLFHGLQPVETLLTLTLAPGATGPQTGTLTFTQVGGMQYSVPYSLSIPVVANADRTITFKNYCTNPMGGAEGSGVVIGITTSATPALNISTSNTQCTTDSDCQNFTFSKCVSGVCGGGACMSDSDCNNSHTGTCHAPAPGKSAQCTYCASDSDCMAGSVCSNNQCFWSIPTPGGSGSAHYVLAPPSGGTIDSTTITIPDYSQTNGYTLQWGGGFSGRTGCTYSGGIYTCNTADCNNSGVTPSADGEGACAVGVGFNTPSTSSEPTFVAMSPDTYDVTIINGATIGMTMYPTNAPTPQAYNNPYLCGAPGSASATATSAGTLGACSWNFVLPTSGGDTNYAYNWVADGGGNCSTNDDCTSPAVCGLSTATITANSLPTKTCGTQLGFLNQNEMCKINASFVMTDVVDCTATYSGNTVLNLLACTGDAATSCYSETGPNTTCCGCTNWQTQGLSVPSNNSIVQQCQYPNPHWAGNATKHITGQVLPNLIWLKRACPSAYVYPYDDASSTFTCPSNSSQSGVNYTIEFCPEQKVSGCYSRRANGTLSHVC